MHTQTIQTSHTNTHTHTVLPVRPLPALLSVAPPKQVTRKSSPERNSLPFLPPFLPNEPLSLCTCVTRCPRATRTTFTHAHYRFSSPPSPPLRPASYTRVGGWRGRGIQTAPRPSGNEPGESVAFSPHLMAENTVKRVLLHSTSWTQEDTPLCESYALSVGLYMSVQCSLPGCECVFWP